MSAAGSIEFKLDYFGTKKVVHSNNFSAGGHQWRITCYPNGYEKEDQGQYLSIYLELMGESSNVKAIFDVFMMGKDGAPASSSHARRSSVQVFPPEGIKTNSWGYPRFVKRSDLESLYVVNGFATIICVAIVFGGGSGGGGGEPLAVPPSDIGAHLGHLLDCAAEDTADVSFVVGGETFPAHRAVLAARSPVFKAQLFGPMKEAAMASIVLHEIAPATFRTMLRFMYTDSLPTDGDSPTAEKVVVVQDLLAAADRYALDRLKLLCASKLWENVSADTIAGTLECAETYNCPELKKKCIEFMAEEKNFKKAVLTDGFVRLAHKFRSVLAELREKVGV